MYQDIGVIGKYVIVVFVFKYLCLTLLLHWRDILCTHYIMVYSYFLYKDMYGVHLYSNLSYKNRADLEPRRFLI